MSITLTLKQNQTKTFDPELLFDANYDMEVTQSGVITFSADLTGAVPGSRNHVRIIPNASAVNFPSESPNGTPWNVLGNVSATNPMMIEITYLATDRIQVVIAVDFALTDVTSFVDHWYANDATKFGLTGSLVDTWTGRQGTVLTGTTTERPTRNATGGENGTGVVEFTGSHCLVNDALATHYSGTDTPWAAMIKVRLRNLVTANNVLFSAGNNADLDPNTGLRVVNDTPRFNRSDDTPTTAHQSFSNTLGSVNYYWLGVRFTGTTVRPYIDGVEDAASPLASNVGALTANRFAVGCLRRDTNTLFAQADIEEFVLFTDNPSDSDWTKSQRYLGI